MAYDKSHTANDIWRMANGLVVHPWLLQNKATANQVNVDDESETIFGSHPDDSLEVLSEADSSLTQPGPLGLHACHVTVTGPISSDEEDVVSDQSDNDLNSTLVKRRLAKTPIQARLRQSRQGRNRAKEGPSTKCHGRVHLSEYSMSAFKYSRSAASG